MSVRPANCPSCGGDIRFRPGTCVSVCGYCSSAVARGDRDLSLMGKVSALTDTHSPLATGASGTYQGDRFDVVGRTQLRHAAGGVWDEWYLAFDDGRWGWLAEAQGRFYLTFERRERFEITRDSLSPGASVQLGEAGAFVVTEVGRASVVTAQGELPYPFKSGEYAEYADLAGASGRFATLDFSERPVVGYFGRDVSLGELSIREASGFSPHPPIATQALSCPSCGAGLTLRLPDQSMRVTCDACSSLLDASHGVLNFLSTLPKAQRRLRLPPGTEGTLKGLSLTSVGYMGRYCQVEGSIYRWDEYLLYAADKGFFWLIESDGHFSFVSPLNAAEVAGLETTVLYKEQSFKRFQEVTATVEVVRGEFYWKVRAGEKVLSADYVNAPLLLSKEVAFYQDAIEPQLTSSELAWSVGEYISPEAVWEGFKLAGSPQSPEGIAPNQPNPHRNTFQAIKSTAIPLAIALIAMQVGAEVFTKENVIYSARHPILLTEDSKNPQVIFSDPFVLEDGRHSIKISTSVADLDNAWAYTAGALVSNSTGEIRYFALENSLYSGVDGGESWREDARAASTTVQAAPPGEYVLRLELSGAGNRPVGGLPSATLTNQPAATLEVEVVSGQIGWLYFWIALSFITAFPMLVWMRVMSFENLRWSESMFGMSGENDE